MRIDEEDEERMRAIRRYYPEALDNKNGISVSGTSAQLGKFVTDWIGDHAQQINLDITININVGSGTTDADISKLKEVLSEIRGSVRDVTPQTEHRGRWFDR